MGNFKERVKQEEAELTEKIERLNNFIKGKDCIFKSLDTSDQNDLIEQKSIMKRYSRVLQKRIAKF